MYGINDKQEKYIVKTIKINNIEVTYDKSNKNLFH